MHLIRNALFHGDADRWQPGDLKRVVIGCLFDPGGKLTQATSIQWCVGSRLSRFRVPPRQLRENPNEPTHTPRHGSPAT